MTILAENALASLFPGDSEMSARMRAHDWAATPLGDPCQWADALKAALRILLLSRSEMWLGWGDELVFFHNDAYRPILGSRHPLALGKPVREVWPEIYCDIEAQFTAVLARGESTFNRATLLLLKRRGYCEESYQTFSCSPLLDGEGRVGGLLCIVVEETERVIGERRLAMLRDLATALQPARSRPAVITAACTAIGANQRDFPFVLFYLLDEAGTATLDYPSVLPTGLTGVAWPFARLRSAHAYVSVDLCAVASVVPSGLWKMPPRQALLVPIGSPDQPPFGVLVLGMNPCRRVDEDALGWVRLLAGQLAAALVNLAALDAHRQRADRVWRLFEQATGFMAFLSGPEHVFEFVNEAYNRLTGPRDFVGKRVRDAFPELGDQGVFKLLDHVYATGKRFVATQLSLRLQRSSAGPLEERFVDFIYEPMLNEAGEVTGIFVEGHDVTDAHNGQEALRHLNETLELRVEGRTAELEQAQEALRQAQKLEAMGQLTGGVAHDFNNLLTPIMGSLDLLQQRGVGDARERRLIDGAMQSAERAKTLVQRLLAFSRRQPLQPCAVDVASLIHGMAALIDSTLGPQIKVLVEASSDLPAARADPNQLEMALLNLSVNARDAMPYGGTLTISAMRESVRADETVRQSDGAHLKRGHYIRITVTDTGMGMDEATLARAIEPFFSTKGVGKGTGLGLSMAHGLAAQLGGTLSITSRRGQGTVVTLWLPVDQAAAMASPAVVGPIVDTARAMGTALLVDDEDLVRAITADMLAELGFRVIEASSAEQAADLFDDGLRVDLLVTDHLMPGRSGVELARETQARWADLPVLIVSGYADTEGVVQDLPRLTKPFRRADLAAALVAMHCIDRI